MWREILADPQVRRAYLLTKAGVFAAATLATIPLAHFLGPKAWVGLGIFGLVLAGLAVILVMIGRGHCETDVDDSEEVEEEKQ